MANCNLSVNGCKGRVRVGKKVYLLPSEWPSPPELRNRTYGAVLFLLAFKGSGGRWLR